MEVYISKLLVYMEVTIMERLPGYDDWKLRETDGYNYVDLDACYYCGIEFEDTDQIVLMYEKDINKTVMVCESCLEAMKNGDL